MPNPVTDIYDNGGRTFDRYTVFFADGLILGIGDTGNVPNGFCMSVDAVKGSHLGTRVTVDALTDAAQEAIRSEVTHG